MSDTNETISAVIAEMRRDADAGNTVVYTSLGLRDLAKRIERAAKRDYEDAKSYFEKLHDGPSMICTAKNCHLRNAAEDIVEQVKAEASLGHFAPVVVEERPGRSAREILEELKRFHDEHYSVYPQDADTSTLCTAYWHIAARPGASVRNCDNYATAKDALDAFIREKEIKLADVDNMNLRDFFDWLFDEPNDEPHGGAPAPDGAERDDNGDTK